MANQGGPGEVTGILEQTDDKRQHKNLRDKYQKRTNPAEHRVRNKIGEHAVADQGQDPATQTDDPRLHCIHGRR